MGLFRGKNVAAGVPVTLKFTADSSAARDMIVTVEDSAYTRFFEKTCHLTPGLQEYTETFTVPESMAVDLKFQLGNIGDAADCGPHTVRLYDIVFE
jgi:hypothetical protein